MDMLSWAPCLTEGPPKENSVPSYPVLLEARDEAAKLENTAPLGLFQFATAAGLIRPLHSSQATSP